MYVELPDCLRAAGSYRRCDIGIDFPSGFYEDLKAIDGGFYLVWHPYSIMWEDIVANQYEGPLDDPRNAIHFEHGHLNFGYVTKNATDDSPAEDNSWHLWRLSWPHGWAHVLKMASTHPNYLALVLSRLRLQVVWHEKYGLKSYQRLLAESDGARREELIQDQSEMLNAWQDENGWLIRRVKDNFSSGRVKPTNPQKERIMSFPGQGKRSRLIVPLSDEDAGLRIPRK
jgi:hypothetical protein